MLNVESLYESLASSFAHSGDGKSILITRAGQLMRSQDPVSQEVTSEELRLKFADQVGMSSVVVVEDRRPIGMIIRNNFMEQYARPYARELYGPKSCVHFMDATPLIVDVGTPIETLVKAAVESGGKVLTDGYITTQHGDYAGIGTGFDLIKAMSEIEAEKTRQLMSSISYASLIQRSHLVESDHVLRHDIGAYGLMWQPRDVVGGDAYFFRKVGDGVFGCVFDCTGHGVPGAFMTLIVLSFLEQQIQPGAAGIQPGDMLAELNVYIKRVLRQSDRHVSDMANGEKSSNDGLDAAMFVLSGDQQSMRFASAKLVLLLARKDGSDIAQIDGERIAIGYSDTLLANRWPTHEVTLGADCLVVIPTDGVIDQIGEAKRIAHGKKRLVRFLQENRDANVPAWLSDFEESFTAWQGKQKRRDDVTLLAFRTRA
jgi:serine phosphatase RsbU (regulator of sigma subunit)